MMNGEDNYLEKILWDKDKPWLGKITLANGKTVTIDCDVDETGDEAARTTLKFLLENEPQIRHKTAVLLFEHYKDWINEDITAPEQLALRIDLSDILISEDGGQLYYYANGDDDMFTSHAICVWFDADGEIEDEIGLAG